MNQNRIVPVTTLEARRVAVIEQLTDDIYSVRFILQSLGFQAKSFSCSDAFISELTAFDPELIVVDMMISKGGGYKVIQDIRKAKMSDRLPILAIIADAMDGTVEDVFVAGGQEILAKPYSMSELRAKLTLFFPSN